MFKRVRQLQHAFLCEWCTKDLQPHRQLPIRLVTQPTSYTDHSGQFWHPDNHYMDGYVGTKRMKIEGIPDPDLFAGERYGHFTYAIPVDTRDRYTLILHFAEFYFGLGEAGGGGEESRVFRVLCNGNTLLDNFDIYKEVGSLHALTKTFYHLKPTAQGKLDITFEPIANNATVSAAGNIQTSSPWWPGVSSWVKRSPQWHAGARRGF